MKTILSTIVDAIRNLGHINTAVQVAPSCILWPDGERQFECVVPVLQDALPSLLVLGDYAPDKKTGPAIWLRCVIDSLVPEVSIGDAIPVIYMPGISRGQLRLVEKCPDALKPLLFLQYRGTFFSQYNGKDWTVFSYLKSKDGGLNLDAAGDDASKSAMLLALPQLLEQDMELLKGKRLDKDFFNNLIAGGDPVRDVLQWLNKGDAWRTSRSEIQWKAFVELCKSNYSFNPETQGHAKGLELFANRKGVWRAVYDRYEEAYTAYTNIPKQLSEMKEPEFGLFATEEEFGGWPQWNSYQEQNVSRELGFICNMPFDRASSRLLELENQYAHRRNTLWARMGLAPMVDALGHLVRLVELSREGYLSDSLEHLADYYDKRGYSVDWEALQAIDPLKNKTERELVKRVVRLVYQPWLEKLNNQFHALTRKQGYASSVNLYDSKLKIPCCYVFVDGLRLDHAHLLKSLFVNSNLKIIETYRWSPLPTMTENCKPAAVPVQIPIGTSEVNLDFNPLKGSGLSFDKYLEQQNIVRNCENTENRSWKEFGDFDKAGHDYGGDLPLHIHTVFKDLQDIVIGLFQEGFKTVRIVTDHGWLWLPGGLPKSELAVGLTDGKWGRYAVIKEGAKTDELQLPWHWNKDIMLAFPPGICAHRSNMEYTHGGLSMQECRLMELTLTENAPMQQIVSIDKVIWKGLRCRFHLQGNYEGCLVAIRRNAVMADNDLPDGGQVKDDGTGSLLVGDDSLLGQAAFLVVLDINGNVVAQQLISIGGAE